MPVFENHTSLACTPEKAFAFLTRPANLQCVAPTGLAMTFVDCPEVISLGSKLKFRVEAYGIVQELEHEIVQFDPPRGFCEKMTRGPLSKWMHEYVLEPSNGGVTLFNRIEFEPPSGLLGMIVTAERMMTQLKEGHEQRSDFLKKALAE